MSLNKSSNKAIISFLLAGISGCLLGLPWFFCNYVWLLFIAFIPLLYAHTQAPSLFSKIAQASISFAIWNILSIWWIYNATGAGVMMVVVLNTLFMTTVWMVGNRFLTKYGNRIGYVAIIAFWLLFEFVHYYWGISFPWINLGNAFAFETSWVQWYEYTGVGGGTLWILLINLMIFDILQKRHTPFLRYKICMVVVSILVPILLSLWILWMQSKFDHQSNKNFEVLVVQPNVDPYSKFSDNLNSVQIDNILNLTQQGIDSTTSLVIWPETALPNATYEDQFGASSIYKPVVSFIRAHPNLYVLTGIESIKFYGTEHLTASAHESGSYYYDVFNSAMLLHDHQSPLFYHKNKLVPGAETLPAPLLFLSHIFEKFGGATSSYGRGAKAEIFSLDSSLTPIAIAPIICYESIYGAYIRDYVLEGANLLTIITNDGWWGNTQGYQQHYAYAKLCAIETRRWGVQDANTGISAFISPTGIAVRTTQWAEKKAISYKIPIPLSASYTFYVQHGDWIYELFGVLLSCLLGLFAIIKDFFKS
ncbi:MAG: apolipoprotein N-acyltransferase [Phycisphaerales bacterium]|nr:apolipoprotein N-acyltransferase [Phycisphaerales bacterium]